MKITKITVETYYPRTKDCIGNIYEFSSSLLEDGAIMTVEHKDPYGKLHKLIYAPCLCNGEASWFNVNLFHSRNLLENSKGAPAKLDLISERYDNMLITLLVLAGKKLKVINMKRVYTHVSRRKYRKAIYAPIFKML